MISVHNTPSNPKTPGAYAWGYQNYEPVSMVEMADIISNKVWSPNTFKGGHRTNDNFISSSYMTLDFDDGLTTLDDAVRSFADYECIIGTSKSHRIISEKNPNGVDRFRVVIPWANKIYSPQQYSFNMTHIIEDQDCDSSCSDLARYYFPCKEIVVCQEGEDFEKYTVLPVTEQYLRRQQEITKARWDDIESMREDYHYGSIKPWMQLFIRKGVLPEKGYSRRWCIYRIALHLYLCEAPDAQIFRILFGGNYDKTGIPNLEREIEARMKSAKKKAAIILEQFEKENPSAKVIPLKRGNKRT